VETSSKISRIPQVDKVLRHPRLVELQQQVRREILTELTRLELENLRAALAKGKDVPDFEAIVESVCARAGELLNPALNRLINATGIILNTNIGRAPIAQPVLDHMSEVASGYCNLELDLQSGKRGERSRNIDTLLSLLTGCESSLVVNNNAAAVLLAVSTLARNREVIVSRGELIEIGGSFRLPDVIVAAGGVLVEVGTTNRTRLSDYKKAITDKTGLLLRCHRSNFEILGFTEEVSLEELSELSRESGIPLLEDLGSGALIDLSSIGFAGEPTVQSQLRAGAELVSFSGDKLLGGPQAGVIVGKKSTIERLHKSPLYRALRPDKMTLAALEMLLTLYLSPAPEKKIPALKMAHAPMDELKIRAESFAKKANPLLKNLQCQPAPTQSAPGGGSLPGKTMASYGLALQTKIQPNQLAAHLRKNKPPVIAVVHDDRTILDLRTVLPSEENQLLEALVSIDGIVSSRSGL